MSAPTNKRRAIPPPAPSSMSAKEMVRPSYPAPSTGTLLDPTVPAFVLTAEDFMAPDYVLQWAAAAEAMGMDNRRVQAARLCARRMNEWRQKKGFKK